MDSNKKERAVLSAIDLQAMGFSRPMVYKLLNRNDLPVIRIGNRRFMHREKFLLWLDKQANGSGKA